MVRAKCVQQEYRWCVPRDLQRPRPCVDGLASAHYAAETASVQGIDLWSEQKHRLIAAMEFHSKLLVQDYSPAIPQYVCNGHGAKLGFSPTMELGYSANVSGSTVLIPETAKHLQKDVRTMDSHSMCRELIMCFETLTHGVALAEGMSSP